MATTPVRTVIGSTGASGVNGFSSLVTAHNTAVNAGISTAIGVTGYVPGSLEVSPTQLVADTTSAIFEMVTSLTYTTQTI